MQDVSFSWFTALKIGTRQDRRRSLSPAMPNFRFMRVLFIKFSRLTLLALLVASCSIQKRTVLPGFHVERIHRVSAKAELGPSRSVTMKEMTPLCVGHLASTFTKSDRPLEQHLNTPPSAQVTSLHAIQPRVPDVDLIEPELLEPQPWDEAYRQQKFFGKLALGLLCLALGLLAAGAGHPLAFVAYFVAQFVNRRKAKKVLDIKEAHGVDVEQERKRLKRSNIALGGAAFASLAVAVVVAVVTILLFLLVFGVIINFFTSL